jgi:putative transposase
MTAQIQGRWFYLYLILNLYNRKIVGFEAHDTNSADHAAYQLTLVSWAQDLPKRNKSHRFAWSVFT